MSSSTVGQGDYLRGHLLMSVLRMQTQPKGPAFHPARTGKKGKTLTSAHSLFVPSRLHACTFTRTQGLCRNRLSALRQAITRPPARLFLP